MSAPKPRLRVGQLVAVSTTEELAMALAAGYPVEKIAITPSATLISAAREEGYSSGRVAAEHDVASNAALVLLAGETPEAVVQFIRAEERARIAKIHNLTHEGLQGIAARAIETGMSPEAFAVAQLEEIMDRGITMAGLRRGAPPVAAHVAPPADEYSSAKGPNHHSIYAARQAKAVK